MKISIVTVCYNSVTTIEQTILSVKNQTYKNKEHIIIDGGSTDGTLAIIQKYSDDLAYWVSEPDNGIFDAMNKGVSYASGDVVSILNSDDWYEEDTLEKVNTYFNKTDCEIVVGNINQVINERIIPSKIKFDSVEDIHFRMIFPHPGMFVKREIYEQIGLFDLKYSIAADYEWTLRAHNARVEFFCVPDVFANFRMSGISTTQAYQVRIENKQIALNNMDWHADAKMAERIEQYYDDILEQNKSNYAYQKVWKSELEYIRTLVEPDKAYYIWGTGLYGEMCYELFSALGIKIVGFMDNYTSQSKVHDYPVCKPHTIRHDERICIATPKYEKEIMRQLQKMGVAKEQYLYFSTLQSKVSDHVESNALN